MAYPTGLLSLVLEELDRRALDVKHTCVAVRAETLVGSTAGSRIISLFNFLTTQRAGLAVASATPGLGPYAQAQKSDGSLDIVAEFTAMLAAIDATTAWIVANFPKDGNGFLLERTWGASGPVDRVFTTDALAGLRAQLDSVIATIGG